MQSFNDIMDNLKSFPKETDVKIEDCTVLAVSGGKDKNYKCTVAEKDGHYYMFEKNTRLNSEFNNIRHLYADDARFDVDTVREIAYDKTVFGDMFFEYTPDDLHYYRLRIDPEKQFCYNPTVSKLTPEQIIPGQSFTFKEMTVIYVQHDNLAFIKNGVYRVMPIEESGNSTWNILKTKIKSSQGAKGLFAELENIAETSKVENHTLHNFFSAFETILQDEKHPPLFVKDNSKADALVKRAYELILIDEKDCWNIEDYSSFNEAKAELNGILDYQQTLPEPQKFTAMIYNIDNSEILYADKDFPVHDVLLKPVEKYSSHSRDFNHELKEGL